MSQLGLSDPQEGWVEVRSRLERLAAHRERGLYSERRPEVV